MANHRTDQLSSGTLRNYRTAWRQFQDWCRNQGGTPQSPPDALLAAWSAELMGRGLSPATVAVKLAAVRWRAEHGTTVEGAPKASGALLTASPATPSLPRRPAPGAANPLLSDLLKELLQPIDRQTSVRGRRDACLILLAFSGALRRSELSGLRIENIRPSSHGLILRVPPRAPDIAPLDVEIVYARQGLLCPVRALRGWLSILRSERLESGWVFYEVTKADRVWFQDDEPLRPDSINRIIKRRVELAGLSGRFSAHSLRAGAITEALDKGESLEMVQEYARHKNSRTTRLYRHRKIL